MPKLYCRVLTLVLLTVCFSQTNAQDNNFWQHVDASSFTTTGDQKKLIQPSDFRALKLNAQALLNTLNNAPKEFTEAARTNPLIISLPTPDGGFARFAVVYSPMMEPGLAAKFPNIRTYTGQGIDDPAATLVMDWTEFGFHAQVRSSNSDKGFYIDPYAQGETTQYMSYAKKDLPSKTHIETGVLEEQLDNLGGLAQKTNAGICLGGQLKSYRIAVACTGEYAVAVGASTVAQALSAITTTIVRVNGIFETELAIRLTLVANNSDVVFINATTDPFTGNNNANTLINESQSVIDGTIFSANYDIGHTFSTGAGGLAQNPAVCWSGSKARGVTGSTAPTGDAYDVDFVAHEIGHQFGGSHSFNAVTGGCNGNRNGATSVEPGSGITIMGYAGLCSPVNNLANNSIPYFHATSQNQIGVYVTSHVIGSSCGTIINTGNAVPVVNAGIDYTIPAGTPFMLTGSATDPNNSEVLTYSWEEIDNGVAGDWNYGGTPFFRSFAPSLSTSRSFPKLSDVINQTTTIGELLPTTSQILNFRLTVRDNRAGGGGICSDDMMVSVSGVAGPFSVTSHSTPASLTANGSNTTAVSWNVAGTNNAPVSTPNVSILFSADGGLTFPYTLVASTPNDGSENVVIPSIKTTQGRIMVKGVGNVFYNINTANLTVTTSCAAEGAAVAPATTVTALRGAGALNLGLSPQYATPFAPSGTLTSTDPAANLAVFNSVTSNCILFGNQMRHDLYTFNVSANGTYTFNLTAPFPTIMNIYLGSFDASNPCANFMSSNGTYNGSSVNIGTTINQNLVAGQVYVLLIGTFSSTQPTLPANYSVAVTPPGGGNAFSGSGAFINPGVGFSYAYVVVNNATGNIVSIGSSDLTNSSTYPAGQYTVYGLSYQTGLALSGYVGGSLTALLTQIQNNPSGFCASLSKNSVTVNVTGTFPVQFTQLKARKSGSHVDLTWGTLTEQNSSHFMVQRSGSGADFTDIGKVQAAGFSNGLRDYSFVDAAPIKGWNYYRLKQFDLDGKFMFSNTAAVNFEKPGSLVVIYPNPGRDVLTIEYTSTRNGKVELQVIDSKGSVVMNRNMSVAMGTNMETIDIASLSKGMYLLRYQEADGGASFIKFVKQ